MKMSERYLPSGVLDEALSLDEVEEHLIEEYVGSSWYEGEGIYQAPDFTTKPDFTGYDVSKRYTWCKAVTYAGEPLECTSLARMLVAYKRGVPFATRHVDDFLAKLGGKLGLEGPAPLSCVQSTIGRTGVRQIETLYIAGLMRDWAKELTEAVKGGDADYFTERDKTASGEGAGFWEAPRGALYHAERVEAGRITGYQIIIPTTWNLSPVNQNGVHGPIEQALIGCPVDDVDKPINALRTIHSFDPCVSCAVHVSQPATGKHFETTIDPWGAR